MSTIDHVLHFASAAEVDLAALGIIASEGERPVTLADLSVRPQTGTFNGETITAIRVRVIAADATFDEAGNELTPLVEVPGVWLAIRAAQLLELPKLVAASDFERKAQGQPHVLYVHPDYPLDSLRKEVRPQWMGSAFDLRSLTDTDLIPSNGSSPR